MMSERSQDLRREGSMASRPTSPRWTFAIVSAALFMVVLDNLVVTTALPSIRASLGAGIQSLEWTVNAYTLTYAVLLLTGAALGDRFGRKRMFTYGLALFTGASAAAPLAPTTSALIPPPASLGIGAALLTAFVAWELRAPAPMLPMRFFRSRAFAATNGVSLAMYFGVFGSIFLLAQFFQVVQHYTPLEAGIRTPPWTGIPSLGPPPPPGAG